MCLPKAGRLYPWVVLRLCTLERDLVCLPAEYVDTCKAVCLQPWEMVDLLHQTDA